MIVQERVRPAPRPAPSGPAPRPVTSTWRSPLTAVLAALPIVALAELLIMRTFYRVGIYIPKQGTFRTVHAVLTGIGSFALNLSSVLVVVALALLAARGYGRARPGAALALGAFGLVSMALAAAGPTEFGPTARLAFVLAVATLAWPFVRGEAVGPQRLAVAAIAGSALLSSYASFAADAGRIAGSVGPGGAVGAQLAAEALVVVAAFALLASWLRTEPFRVAPLLVAVGPAVGLVAMWRANGAITGILVLWTTGLRLYLPMWLYALALWAFGAAAIGWRRSVPLRSAGLALLLAAGMLLGSTYLQALLLVALVLLTDGVALGGLEDVGRAVARPSEEMRRRRAAAAQVATPRRPGSPRAGAP